jgi:membrane associated rhomboid family serine protease
MKIIDQLKEVPMCTFISVTLVVVFLLYITTIVKTVPCGKDILSAFYSQFIHLDINHLGANLLALYSLSRVERKIGWSNFMPLLLFLMAINAVIEVGVHKIFPNVPCSIGFSGILFGILTWEMVSSKKLDIIMFLSIVFMVIWPSMKSPKVSLSGHCIGAISGIIGGLVWNYVFKTQEIKKSNNNNKWLIRKSMINM